MHDVLTLVSGFYFTILGVFIASSPKTGTHNKIRPVLNFPFDLFIRLWTQTDGDFHPLQKQLLFKTMDMSLDRSFKRFVKVELGEFAIFIATRRPGTPATEDNQGLSETCTASALGKAIKEGETSICSCLRIFLLPFFLRGQRELRWNQLQCLMNNLKPR